MSIQIQIHPPCEQLDIDINKIVEIILFRAPDFVIPYFPPIHVDIVANGNAEQDEALLEREDGQGSLEPIDEDDLDFSVCSEEYPDNQTGEVSMGLDLPLQRDSTITGMASSQNCYTNEHDYVLDTELENHRHSAEGVSTSLKRKGTSHSDDDLFTPPAKIKRAKERASTEADARVEQWRVGKTPGHQGSHIRDVEQGQGVTVLSEKRSLNQVSLWCMSNGRY
jgi:hypothetical protein